MNNSVPLKLVLAVVGALVVLGGTFYAGMAYQSHRISESVEDAFSGLGEDLESGDFTGDTEGEAEMPDPVELGQGEPVVLETSDGGELTVTLLKTSFAPEPGSSEELDRAMDYYLKVQNTGDVPAESSLSGHYETDDGQVLEFAGVYCDDNEMPEDTLRPGQFAEGCNSHDLPNAAGRLVFDEVPTPFFIKVPAGS